MAKAAAAAAVLCALVLASAAVPLDDEGAFVDGSTAVNAPPSFGTAQRLRALNRHITHHERVFVDPAWLQDQADAAKRSRRASEPAPRVRVPLRAFGQALDLDLARTDAPFARGLQVLLATPSGVPEAVHVDRTVFFRGHAGGHGAARATVFNGTLEATLMVGREMYFVEPATPAGGDAMATSGPAHNHVMYRLSDVHPETAHPHAACGDPSLDSSLANASKAAGRRAAPPPFDPSRLTCEMYLAADHRLLANQGDSVQAVTTLLLGYLEDLNLLYKITHFTGAPPDIVGVNFALKTMVIWRTADSVLFGQSNPFATSTDDSQVFLNQFGTTVGLEDYCLGHAFTTQEFANGVLGLAWRPDARAGDTAFGICSHGWSGVNYNIGVTTHYNFGSFSPRIQTVLVFAHEVGHNFASPHDTACDVWCGNHPGECGAYSGCTNCAVNGGSNGNYIMWPLSVDGSRPNNALFSACSREEIGLHIRNMGGCFTATGAGPICGNGIVEGPEECDCGSTDPAACADYDPCCNTTCQFDRANGAECSARAGECCDQTCRLFGYASFAAVPAGATAYLCRAATACQDAVYCLADAEFLGRCPDADYPYHGLTTPEGCDLYNASTPDCRRYYPADPDPPYRYHKPDGTPCNGGANVCAHDGCTGSVCGTFAHNASGSLFAPVECSLFDGTHDCFVACRWTSASSPCLSTAEVATTSLGAELGVTPILRPAGAACANYTGYCGATGTCRGVSEKNPLSELFNFDVFNWLSKNWWIVGAATVGAVGLVFLLRCTYRRKTAIIRTVARRASSFRRSVRGRLSSKGRPGAMSANAAAAVAAVAGGGKGQPPLRRKLGGAAAATRITTEQAAAVKQKLQEKKEQETVALGFQRLHLLFPAAPASVLGEVVRCSPHERAAVYRLLLLGYGLDTTVPSLRPEHVLRAQPRGDAFGFAGLGSDGGGGGGGDNGGGSAGAGGDPRRSQAGGPARHGAVKETAANDAAAHAEESAADALARRKALGLSVQRAREQQRASPNPGRRGVAASAAAGAAASGHRRRYRTSTTDGDDDDNDDEVNREAARHTRGPARERSPAQAEGLYVTIDADDSAAQPQYEEPVAVVHRRPTDPLPPLPPDATVLSPLTHFERPVSGGGGGGGGDARGRQPHRPGAGRPSVALHDLEGNLESNL